MITAQLLDRLGSHLPIAQDGHDLFFSKSFLHHDPFRAAILYHQLGTFSGYRTGRRPSFDPAADPQDAQRIFDDLVRAVKGQGVSVQTGRFGASMLVSSINDGPATFIIQTDRKPSPGIPGAI
jgi:hypothetical protein